MFEPPPELRFPPPPTTADTKSEPAATLTWLQDRIAAVYLVGSEKPSQKRDSPKLTRTAYLDFYTTAHNYCHITKIARGAPPVGSLSGGDLYRILENEIRKFCGRARGQILGGQEKRSSEVENARNAVEEYMVQWRRLQYLANLLTNLLQPLEKDWIQRAIAEKQKGVHLLRDLHVIVWKEIILQVGEDSSEADTGSVIAGAVASLRGGQLKKKGSVSDVDEDEDVEVFTEHLRTIGVTLGDPL
jgi:hypothetical protein